MPAPYELTNDSDLLTHYHLHKQAIAGFPTGKYHKIIIQFLLQFLKIHFVNTIDSELESIEE